MRNIIIIGLCMFLLVISSCTTQDYIIDDDSVHWENDYGRIEVTPHTCSSPYCIYDAEITMFLSSQDYDFAFRFDEQLTNAHLYEWKELSKQVYNNETHQFETVYYYNWVDRTNAFTMDTYDGSYYYWVSGVSFTQNIEKKYRWEFNKPDGDGKWELLAKRTSETLISAIENENYIILDPWYTEGAYLDSWALTGTNQNPYGIGANNTHLWIADVSTDYVYKYARDGTYIGSWSNTGKSMGVVIDNTYIWTVDQDAIAVYKYDMDGGAITNWAVGGTPNGLAGNSTHLFVLDGNSVDIYLKNGSSTGTWNLHANNGNSWGITTDGINMWVSDNVDDLVYKYEMDGTYLSNWSLHADNDLSTGIAYNLVSTRNASFFTIDYTEVKAYEYDREWLDIGVSVSDVSLLPNPAYPSSIFNCSGFVNDSDPTFGNNLNVNLTSYQNGSVYSIETMNNIPGNVTVSSTTIFPTPLILNHEWYCTIYAEDITNSSRNDTSTSSTVTIISSPPSVPTTLTPVDNSVYFNSPILTCSGSIDPEGDTINYTFAASDNTSLQNSQSTTYTWTELTAGTEDDWKCRACDVSLTCSNYTALRNISYMKLELCSIANESLVLNFTSWDETNTSENLTANWDAALTMSSVTGSNSSNFELNNNHTLSICLTPKGSDVTLDGLIEYVPTNASLYSYARQYYFTNDIRNSDNTSHVKVYSLLDSLATAITFHVTEGGTTALEDASLLLERYYPGTGVYDLVAMGETSALGRDIIYLQLTDAWYRISCYDSTGLHRYTSGPEHITSSDYYINLAGEPGEYNETERWYAYDDIDWSLTFDNNTNITTLTWEDETGYLEQMCFRLSRYSMSGTGYEALVTSCVSATSGSLNYTITTSGLYIAKAIGYHGGNWRLLGSLEIDLVDELEELIGLDGVLLSIILIGTMAFLGLYSPTMTIVFTQISLVMVKAFGLLNISWGAIIGIIFIGFILLFKQKGR